MTVFFGWFTMRNLISVIDSHKDENQDPSCHVICATKKGGVPNYMHVMWIFVHSDDLFAIVLYLDTETENGGSKVME